MDFRRKSSSLYCHFVFYPNSNFERKAVDQCHFVRDSLRDLLLESGVDFLIGGHLFSCYKQCGFKDDGVACIQTLSPSLQSGRFPAGKCYILPDAQDSTTLENHIHCLVFAPAKEPEERGLANKVAQPLDPMTKNNKKTKLDTATNAKPKEENCFQEAFEHDTALQAELESDEQNNESNSRRHLANKTPSPTVARDTVTSVNWEQENIVRKIQHFFHHTLGKMEQYGSFYVQQRSVWCPYSIWSSFWGCINENFTFMHGDVFENLMPEERKRHTADYANRELYPKRAPKMRAKVVWEFHCLWQNERQ